MIFSQMFRGVVLTVVSLLLLSTCLVTGEEITTPFTEITDGSTYTFGSTYALTDPPENENEKGDGSGEEEGPTEVTEYTFTYPLTTDANAGGGGDGSGAVDPEEKEKKKKEKKEKKEGKGSGEKKEKKEKDPEKAAAKKAKRKEKKAQKKEEGGTGGRRKGKGKKKGKGKGGEEPTESDSESGGKGRGRGRGRKKKKKVNKNKNGETDGTGEGEEGSVTGVSTGTFGSTGSTSVISTSRAPIIISTPAPTIEPCSAGDYMTENGCQQCVENTYSGDGAESCTSCPDGKLSAAGSTSEDDCEYAPCSAGDYMTENGCHQCGENTYSGDAAVSCTSCPDGKLSAAGSTSEDDCEYAPCSAGDYMTENGCQQCVENTYSGDGAESCTSCPEGGFSPTGSTSETDCGPERRPTCNCWTAECGYCTNKACTIKQDRPGIEVEIHSPLTKETVNTIVLFDESGNTLGTLQLSLRGIFLTGCVRCRAPPLLRKSRNKEGPSSWTLSLKGSVMQISIGGKVLVEKQLGTKCAGQYAKVSRFAFHKMSCESTFSFVERDMEAGELVTSSCNDSCTSD